MNTNMISVPHLATALKGPLLTIEKHFLEHQVQIETWFRNQWQKTRPLIYGSVDLRNAGFKIAPVDTNLFPAGFNNLNPAFMSLCVQAAQATIAEICPDVTRLLLIPEGHTRNIFYFESLAVLQEILLKSGFEVRIGSPNPELTEPVTHKLPSGKEITLEPLIREGDKAGVKDYFPCCIILNNDLTAGVPDALKDVSQKIMPATKLGWATRLKSVHFSHYNDVANELAQHINLDPWLINPLFTQCPEVDFMRSEGMQCLVKQTEILLDKIKQKYAEHKIDKTPFVVVKSDQGTYGMAVMTIQDPKELASLNRKQRTRMSAQKGGGAVSKAIIQEGVYTFETVGDEEAVAEPVVYMIGRHVVGGFYRVHQNRGPNENLNAPGMNFHPLAFVEPCNTPSMDGEEPTNRFYAYGVIARLAFLSAARELEQGTPA